MVAQKMTEVLWAERDLRDRMLNDGAEPEGSSAVEFEKHLSTEIAKWRKVVKAAGMAAG